MLSKRAALLLLCMFPMSANSQSPQPKPEALLIGTWQPISAAFNELGIIVQRHVLNIGDCSDIRYEVIRDRAGYGHGPPNARSGHAWREIAIELMPDDAEHERCLQWSVLDFSIPIDSQASANIALFKTRTEFEKNSEYFGWGVWVPIAAKADKR
jgi:hypothetical protein